MAEIWDLVNENKKKTGFLIDRNDADKIPGGFYHVTIRVWIKDVDGKVLLTQRHPGRPDGLLWESTSGAVVHNEESKHGAVREVFEETGIVINEDELIYLGDSVLHNSIEENYMLRLNDFQFIFIQEDEIINAKSVTVDEIEKLKNRMTQAAWISFEKYRDKLVRL